MSSRILKPVAVSRGATPSSSGRGSAKKPLIGSASGTGSRARASAPPASDTARRTGDVAFTQNQWEATLAAMTANFLLNNYVTYRDRKRRGAALARGLLLFYAVCGIGAAANVGVATLLVQDGVLAWGMAGVAGALITVVWNYAVSSTLVWPAAR